MEEAPDPTLIIWKNLGVTDCNRCARSTVVYLLSAVVVLLSFWLIAYLMNLKNTMFEGDWRPSTCSIYTKP